MIETMLAHQRTYRWSNADSLCTGVVDNSLTVVRLASGVAHACHDPMRISDASSYGAL